MTDVFNMIGDIWSWLMSNLFYINIILSIAVVFFQRRDPKAVWTWLLVLYFIPIVGFILYLIICQDFHKSKMFRVKEIEDKLNGTIRKQEEQLVRNEMMISDDKLQEYSDLILYNLETNSAIYDEDNSIEFYTDGNDKFAHLFDDMKNAKEYIHIQYYIIQDDDLLSKLEEVLYERINAGVEVRILFDGMGSRGLKHKTKKRLAENGVKLGEFFPAFLKRFQLRMNYRNHRKIVVIDGKVAYTGGFNVGNEYLGLKKRFGRWRDTHMRIMGSAVMSLQLRFVLDWNYATKENLFEDDRYFKAIDNDRLAKNQMLDNIGMQIISSGPDKKRAEIRDNYLRLINKAKHTIYVQTPYFIPDEPVLQALSIAARSGVEVKIMIPCKPDHMFVYWATYSYIGEMLDAGAKCYIYNDGFLHAKGIMVDGLVSSYGTANMDQRSLLLNFEVNAVIYNVEATKRLEDIFIEDLKKSTELTKYDYDRRSLIIRFKEQISRLLSPIM